MGGMGGMGGFPGGMGGMGGMPGMGGPFGGMGGMGGMAPRGPRQDPPVSKHIPFSLEDLYHGSTKRLKITRTIQDGHSPARREDEILEVVVKPGYKKGTKITFPQKGESRVVF